MELQEVWLQTWREEVAEVKKEFPHVTEEVAKLLALDVSVPKFVMYAMNQPKPKKQEGAKNVKRRQKEQGDDKQTEFDLGDGAS